MVKFIKFYKNKLTFRKRLLDYKYICLYLKISKPTLQYAFLEKVKIDTIVLSQEKRKAKNAQL